MISVKYIKLFIFLIKGKYLCYYFYHQVRQTMTAMLNGRIKLDI